MSSRKKVIILCIVALLNLVVFYASHVKQQENIHGEQMAAMAAPDFNWKDFSGKTHNIKELAGHTVVIHFWATWCGPCRQEFPVLLQAAKTLNPDVIFLTISGDDSKDAAQKFIAHSEEVAGVKNAKNVIYAFDPDKTISFDIFQTAVYPESVVVDPKQNMQRKFSGSVNWNNPETVKTLKSYIK
jgi:thiol-disulfide isomerase/thioredoxin